MSGTESGVGPIGCTVAANILRIRSARKITKRALSDAVAERGRLIPPLGIARIEARERRVDADDLVALAAALGVHPATLLQEPKCTACHGAPPAGFACMACGAEAVR